MKPWMKALAIKSSGDAKQSNLIPFALMIKTDMDQTHIELALEDNIMIYASQHQEYSARFGLKSALNDLNTAQQIAEKKYKSLVGREILSKEISEIHKLIEELRAWVITMDDSAKTACKH